MSSQRVTRDPYSDNPRDYVVFDDATFAMPFHGTKAQCERYLRAIADGHDAGEATHLAHGGTL